MWDVLGAIIAFVGGTLISVINYFVSKFALAKKPNSFAVVFILRQAINVAYVIGAYFVAPLTPFDVWYCLIGAVLGTTLPALLFTKKLLDSSRNVENKNITQNSDASTEKEDSNGSK